MKTTKTITTETTTTVSINAAELLHMLMEIRPDINSPRSSEWYSRQVTITADGNSIYLEETIKISWTDKVTTEDFDR